MIVLVAAVGRNRVIGSGGRLPWSLPDDLRRFRRITLGKPVVMGRATFESIGRPLAERTNIVLSRRPDWSAAGVSVAGGPTEAVDLASRFHGPDAEICVIGGAQVYSLFIDNADRLELTLVDASPPGDAHFPEWDPQDWHTVFSESHPGPPAFEFRTLVRRRNRA